MAYINEVNGVYGGVEFGTTEQAGAQGNIGGTGVGYETGIGTGAGYETGEETVEQAGTNLPVKTGFWNSFKSFWFREIKVELTPYQQKVENEINEFLHQEITWEKVHDFLFQEIKFGKKRNV